MSSDAFLEPVTEPSDANVDIVAVHGLNPFNGRDHAKSTWTAPNGKLWLKDFLPDQIPQARIFLFSYNANPAFSSGSEGVYQQANNLLVKLNVERDEAPDRPLIFVCHSLGGLIVKRAMVQAQQSRTYERLLKSVYGLVFFATPHRGGNNTELGDIAARIARFVVRTESNSYLEALRSNTFFAEALRYDFRNRQEDFLILTFYETRPTKAGIIVDIDSAVLGLGDDQETVLGLAADHSGLCRFEDENGLDYRPVWKYIKRLVDGSLERAQNERTLISLRVPNDDVTGAETVGGQRDDALSRLPYAVDAPFNANYWQHEHHCLPNTRVDLLKEIYTWADGQDERCIFWLNGLAGTGKSTIARTVARRYLEQERLGASFFFSRGGGDIGDAEKFVTTIAQQLAISIPSLKKHMCDALKESPKIASLSLHDQWQQLVLRPLSKLGENGCQSPYILVVDALDECDDDDDVRIVIRLLTRARSLKTVQLRVFLTSRPESPIRKEFDRITDAEHNDFVLNIRPLIVDNDISVFFEHNLKLIGQAQDLDICWPDEETIKSLIQAAGGLFIWAATACRFIQDGALFVDERVQALLEGSASIPAPEEHPEKHPEGHLNKLYTTILKESIPSNYSTKEKKAFLDMLRCILGSIVVLFSPLSTNSLNRLLSPKLRVDRVLMDFHAILDMPKVDTYPLRLHHPSFRDFLLDRKRCEDANFWVNEKQAHQVLANSCIRLMSTSLKQDICGIDAPGKLAADIERSRVEQSLSPEVQYACLYWVQHLRNSGAQLCDDRQAHQFLQKHLLHWLEALGWIGKAPEGVHVLTSLESFVSSSSCPRLSAFVHDMTRGFLYNRSDGKQLASASRDKPENILWFKCDGKEILVLSDLGLADVHREASRSNRPGMSIPVTPNYRSPECDMEGGTISRSSDIWTLGCLFLEFVVWTLCGWEGRNEFNSERYSPSTIERVQMNVYYKVMHLVDEPNMYAFAINDKVIEWFASLHKHPDCSQYIHDFLDLIQERMLVVESDVPPIKRIRAPELLEELGKLREKCNDANYCLTPCPRETAYQRPLPVGAPLNQNALNEIFVRYS